jgi:hypothetical protein
MPPKLVSAGTISSTTKMSGGAEVEGLKEVLRALQRMDKEAQVAVRDEVQKISNMLAGEITSVMSRSRDSRVRHVGRTVRGTRERTPVIKIGKATRLPVSRGGTGPRASDLMFGIEFGANQAGRNGFRFPERTPKLGQGNEGYWIYPTIRKQQPRVVDLWAKALDKVAAEWSK